MHTLNWGKQRINSLFSGLIKRIITEDEFNDLSDELYKNQTRLRSTMELEKELYQRGSSQFKREKTTAHSLYSSFPSR